MPANYSFEWSNKIVKQLMALYPRGSYTVSRILGITDRNLVNYLAKGDKLWPILRSFVKYSERCFVQGEQIVSDYEIALRYRKNVYGPDAERLKKRLTRFLDDAIVVEQVKELASGGVLTDGSLPFVLEGGYVQYTLFPSV